MDNDVSEQLRFNDLELNKSLLKALNDVGYEMPTPIQAKTIPLMLAGKDLLGQAQTGTGKTAAFALPLLSRINLKKAKPQVLVLTPTRELAIQVAEAFQQYATHLKGFHILPIYGGQEYGGQLRRLKRGVHVVVGTPGRVMDHIRRKSLKLDSLFCLVLDEADEMLRMGFIDDVEWILGQTPAERQIALFSATIPKAIRKIAQKYLKDPEEITIKTKTTTVESTRQRFWMVSGYHKLDALTRILEAEPFDAILIFVHTKIATHELAEKLAARGFACAAINGDIPQNRREKTIEQLKSGKINILVATDVAARGLDVDRISHVINYDIPHDTENYVHRIGRTGRMGRKGEAILFLAPREKHMLQIIEKATKQKIKMMELPSTELINDTRIERFKQRITDALATEELDFYSQLIDQYCVEHNVPALDIAAALAKLVQGDSPMLLSNKLAKPEPRPDKKSRKKKDSPNRTKKIEEPDEGMERFRIEVGKTHGVKPGNIVGAIANEAGINAEYIGKIYINDDFSTVDLPEGIPYDMVREMKKIWVAGQQLKISRLNESVKKRGSKKKRRTRTEGNKEAGIRSRKRKKK